VADFVTVQCKSNIGQSLNNLVKLYVLLTMHLYTGRFIMSSMITNIYNKKTKGDLP